MILCVPELALEAGPAPASPRWPRLARLLARADLAPASGDIRSDLARWLGLADAAPLPVAPLTAAIDVPALAASGARVVRADPVHLRADPNLVLLVAAEAFELSADEADALLAALARELPAYGWCQGEDPRRWYAILPPEIEAATRDPAWLSGRSLTPHLPAGPEARALRRLLNEAQMVLHAAPVNAAREARGLPAVNAVWLWGAGTLPAPQPPRASAVHGPDVLAAGLARHARVPWSPTIEPAAILAAGGEPLVVWGAPHGAAGPVAMSVDALESALLPCLEQGLARGAWCTIELRLATHAGCLKRVHRLRIWRRPPRLALSSEQPR